jgi:hypothetical protein
MVKAARFAKPPFATETPAAIAATFAVTETEAKWMHGMCLHTLARH